MALSRRTSVLIHCRGYYVRPVDLVHEHTGAAFLRPRASAQNQTSQRARWTGVLPVAI